MAVEADKRRSYGIPSQRSVSFLRAARMMRESGAVLDNLNSNCLFAHSGEESTKHWMVKALLFKVLRDCGRTVGTEIETRGGIVDVLDADNLVGYEVETRMSRNEVERKCRHLWSLHDVVFVDASKIPDSMLEAERCIRNIVV